MDKNNSINLKLEIIKKCIEIFDIGYITIIYFIFAIIVAKLFNYFFGPYHKEDDANKHSIQIAIELCGVIWLIGISTYIVRKVAKTIPSPFDGIYDFHHELVRELSTAGVYTLILYQCSFFFRGKLDTFLTRFFNR